MNKPVAARLGRLLSNCEAARLQMFGQSWIRRSASRSAATRTKTKEKENDSVPARDNTPIIVQHMYKSLDLQSTTSNSTAVPEKDSVAQSLKELKWDVRALEYRENQLGQHETDKDSAVDAVSASSQNAAYKERELRRQSRRRLGVAPLGEKMVIGGTPDVTVPVTDVACGGCGARLHCQDPAVPGYMPSEKLKGSPTDELRKMICQRCFLMTQHNMILNVNIDSSIYKNVTRTIKKDKALVLMVVDVTDIRNSIVENFTQLIGNRRPMYVIGNKIDLIPKDETGYLQRIKDELTDSCIRAGLNPSGNNIRHVALVSAKTGYGIEELITRLMLSWELKGNVYLVGSANSGKSTLFNTLLSSDYCKSKVRDIIRRATVSAWPGTTLQMLKFPIINPTPWRLERRRRRLIKTRADDVEHERLRKTRLKESGRSRNAILVETVEKTDFRSNAAREESPEEVPSGDGWFTLEFKNDEIVPTQTKTQESLTVKQESLPPYLFPTARWFYDTPGLITEKQVLRKLTADELRIVLPREMIRPRVFVMKPKEVMFVGGLGRLDYLQGVPATMVTVHTSALVPVHVVRGEEADDFYSHHLGQEVLGVPLGGEDRLNKLPSLVARDFNFTCTQSYYATADIQLSALGWVSVRANYGTEVHIRAYTPGGVGMHLRKPSLLPNMSAFKGTRMKGTAEYQMKRLQC